MPVSSVTTRDGHIQIVSTPRCLTLDIQARHIDAEGCARPEHAHIRLEDMRAARLLYHQLGEAIHAATLPFSVAA